MYNGTALEYNSQTELLHVVYLRTDNSDVM